MTLEERKPVVVCKNLYKGQVFDIWAAWQEDEPHNYYLGRSELEARENFSLRLDITFEHAAGGGIEVQGAGRARSLDDEGRKASDAANQPALGSG
jgi:hypothetical protein